MAQTDAPDTIKTARPPRQRRAKPAAPAFADPDEYANARQRFEGEAQRWLLGQPDRTMMMPDDLAAVVALGVPCRNCGASVYRNRDAGHAVRWERSPGGHWAAGITVTCA